ncbi:hypothetical protein UFOVP182_3 [uncultured Caudovirales phage]|uniref:DUF1360 domain-containing protein n=1 Tax=uncultured Caudovirales phage TaxID=2100421 RepID=A0A6J7WDT4_9CAUD|nr:hypothetical protein UFOVP182_3 [uncultured Caudovirales phage]
MIIGIIIFGMICLNVLSYESPYQIWMVDYLNKKMMKNESQITLFFIKLFTCLGCYSFWYNTIIYLILGMGLLSPFLGGISAVLGVLLLKKYRKL